MKVRVLPESNYRAIYSNGKTLRLAIDPRLPIKQLDYPEFYDVKITSACNGGCPYCYQSSNSDGEHYADVPEKVRRLFGGMTENQRPFQVAIGGGEPTLHPQFDEICKTFSELGIDPNYTTNGTSMTDAVMETTMRYVNGVAVSCHEHLPWRDGVRTLLDAGIYTNLHIIISDDASVDSFLAIRNEFAGKVKYFVLLPMVAQGRATSEMTCWPYLREQLGALDSRKDIAFGAMFYPYLRDVDWGISLYEPEAMSRYLVMDDEMRQYPSSFSIDRAA